MADIRDSVEWKDKRKIWARIASAKSVVTRACTAIDKLDDCEYTIDTIAASRDSRKRLLDAFDFCVELHDRWSDLKILDGNESTSVTAEVSIKPYKEKQFALLKKLDKYIAENAKAQTATSVAEAHDHMGTIPKLETCKHLFQEKLSKSKNPCEFRLWVAAFERFHDASGLKQQSVATQQGYLPQALDRMSWHVKLCRECQFLDPPDASTSSKPSSIHFTQYSTGMSTFSRSGETRAKAQRTSGIASQN